MLVLTDSHPSGVTQGIATSVSTALRQLQLRVAAVSVSDPRAREFWGFSPDEVAACISVTGQPCLAHVYGKPIHQLVDCPIYLWILDSPIYELLNPGVHALAHLAQRDPRYRFLFSDRAYTAFMQKLLGPEVWVGFWPFSGHFANNYGPNERGQRIGVFANLDLSLHSRIDPASSLREVIAGLNPFSLDPAAIDTLVGKIVSPRSRGNAALVVMNCIRTSPASWLHPRALQWVGQIDSHQKRERRVRTTSRLKGLPVDIFGAGWEQTFGDVESFRFHPPIRFDAIAQHMRGRTVILNFDPNWDDGFHDRVYTGIGMGCRILTNANGAARELQRPAGSLAQYNVNNPEIEAAAADMLTQPPLDPDEAGAFAVRNGPTARAHQLLALTGGLVPA